MHRFPKQESNLYPVRRRCLYPSYPTGELKHGPNALVDDRTALIVLATCDRNSSDSALRYEKTVSLLRDLQMQNPQIISTVSAGDTRVKELSRHSIVVPTTSKYISPIYEVVPLQLLAYFMATDRNINVDSPRSLAKAAQ